MADAPKGPGGGIDDYGKASIVRNIMEFTVGTPIRLLMATIGGLVMTVLGK